MGEYADMAMEDEYENQMWDDGTMKREEPKLRHWVAAVILCMPIAFVAAVKGAVRGIFRR